MLRFLFLNNYIRFMTTEDICFIQAQYNFFVLFLNVANHYVVWLYLFVTDVAGNAQAVCKNSL